MADETGEMTVAQRLGHLLDRGLLPAGGPAEAAERLIERLERPARIALLGLPGAGKSAVLNLLAGTVVVPEELRLPTIIVQHGPQARMLCTLVDGRLEIVPGSDLSLVMAMNPAMVTLELDLASLKVISLLEVSAGPMEAEQRRAAIWASKRADIVIWCTTSYLPKEQAVWEGLPDSVKDNGFLFLTKVDLLGSKSAAAGMFERVELRAGEEFRQVLPISAKQARTAMLAPGGLDREMFRDSGASAVISTIKTRVQMARQADTDMAELLLARHVEVSSSVGRHFAEPQRSETVAPRESRPWTPPPDEPLVLSPVVRPATTEPSPPVIQEEKALSARAPDVPVPQEQPKLVLETAQRQAPEASQSASTGTKRFSDRIRQAPVPEEAPAASAVPLKTTWKSRNEAAAPPPAPEPPSAPKPSPRAAPGSTGPGSTGPDDAAIAAMLAAVAASSTEPRSVRDKSAQDRGAAKAQTGTSRQLFGGGKPPAEAPPDLSALRGPEGAVGAGNEEQPRAKEPPARQARPEVPAAEAVERLASPRVALLRDRRPESATPERSERRERPRISARVATAPVETVAPAPSKGPIPATERSLLEQAINLIITRSAALNDIIDPDEKLPIDLILEHGRETTEQVIDLLSRGGSAELRRINGDLGEVLDLIMLMQLEKGHAPADDTLTLLLQIRRDLETLRAA